MLRIRDILKPQAVTANLKATKKREALKELVELLASDVGDQKAIVKGLVARENLGSTGIGQGIAVPHTRTNETDTLVAAFGISKKGVSFNALDGEPVYIFFLLVAPPESSGPHLKALARISRILRDSAFCAILRTANSEEDVYRLITKEDEKNQ